MIAELKFFADARSSNSKTLYESMPVGASGAKHLVGTLYEAALALRSLHERTRAEVVGYRYRWEPGCPWIFIDDPKHVPADFDGEVEPLVRAARAVSSGE